MVKVGRRPPAGLGLDNGVVKIPPAIMELEARQGLLDAHQRLRTTGPSVLYKRNDRCGLRRNTG